MGKLRIGIAGCGHRGYECFAQSLSSPRLSDRATVAALFDHAPTRLTYARDHLGAAPATFTDYAAFLDAEMDLVIVATPDSLHREFTVAALAAGHDVLVEKPLATTVADCDAILAAARQHGRRCLVFHNMRFGPTARKIKALIDAGAVGRPAVIVFDDFLDIAHGSDYFRRWHSRHALSGGLITHKGCHALDLLNALIGAKPKRVFATGGRAFYVPRQKRGQRCLTCRYTDQCPCYFDIRHAQGGFFDDFYRAAEPECGYVRDRCVFSDEVDIHDHVALAIEWEDGVRCTYSEVAFGPYKDRHIRIAGTDGRIEADLGRRRVLHWDLLGAVAARYDLAAGAGGHGGSDVTLITAVLDHFQRGAPAPVPVEEAREAIAIASAANRSIATGQPVACADAP